MTSQCSWGLDRSWWVCHNGPMNSAEQIIQDTDRIKALEAELANMIRVVNMVRGFRELEVDTTKKFRRYSKGARLQSIQTNLGLYVQCAENVLGRKISD